MSDNRDSASVKCRKCRSNVLEDINYTYKTVCSKQCGSYNNKILLYLLEEKLPMWVKQRIEEEQWTKGKLNCEKCRYKIGSFDFLSGRKCACGNSVLPPVHLVLSQIDLPLPLHKLFK